MTQRTFLDYIGLKRFLDRLKAIIPTKTSELQNDSGYLTQHNPVDSSLSETSENAVQNKVVKDALDGKSDTGHTHTASEVSGLSTVATSGSYNDLSNTPTIPTVNNKTLTIQKNGTTVNTFTANSASDVTANITVPTAVSELTNDSGYLTSASSLDSSKLTGTIDIARLPKGALERLVTVANQTARFALTTSDVQLGDTVKQLDTGVMYIVTDESKLSSADGYTEYTAGSATSVPWSGVTGKPSDFTPSSHTHGNVTNDGKLPTASRALISDSSKNITVSSVSDTELGFLSGVTSSVQTQLNGKAASTHVHGNITNDGKVGTTANKPLITGTGGAVQAGSFGNAANTFCEGNDSRLSDARTPVAHTHLTADVTDLLSNTHTWTSQQSYNSDLNLNYASTDVDDIVNSVAGSATLDNFVHMTGDETVNGIKSFPDGIVANVTGSATSATNDGSGNVISSTYGKLGAANTWSESQTYDKTTISNSAEVLHCKNANVALGETPASEYQKLFMFKDKNNDNFGYYRHFYQTNGSNQFDFFVRNKFTNGALDTSGSIDYLSFSLRLNADKSKEGVLRGTFRPYDNNAYDLGSSSYQWNNLYAKNYYYNGTAFTDKFITTDTVQTISAEKKFTVGFSLKNTAVTSHTTAPSSETNSKFLFLDGNDRYWGSYTFYWLTDGTTETRLQHTNYSTSGGQGWWQLAFGATKDFNNVYFRPFNNATINLGDSTHKWKTFNGVNPGALSLPDTLGISGTENVNYFNVIGYLNNTGTPATIPSTATYDGWLYINAKDGAGSYITVDDNPSSFGTSVFGNNGLGSQSVGLLCLICPIRAGHSYSVRVKSDGIVNARIYPAQGNV